MTYMLLVENLQGNPRKFYRDIPANSTGKPFELLLHKIFILSLDLAYKTQIVAILVSVSLTRPGLSHSQS